MKRRITWRAKLAAATLIGTGVVLGSLMSHAVTEAKTVAEPACIQLGTDGKADLDSPDCWRVPAGYALAEDGSVVPVTYWDDPSATWGGPRGNDNGPWSYVAPVVPEATPEPEPVVDTADHTAPGPKEGEACEYRNVTPGAHVEFEAGICYVIPVGWVLYDTGETGLESEARESGRDAWITGTTGPGPMPEYAGS